MGQSEFAELHAKAWNVPQLKCLNQVTRSLSMRFGLGITLNGAFVDAVFIAATDRLFVKW